MFEIKYEIFEDHISELCVIDLKTFNKEYNQIYGCFTLMVNGIEYLQFPSPEMRLETKHIFSELILTHFEFLIDAYFELITGDYIALKYIENPWTWLEFIRNGDSLIVNEYHHDKFNQQALITDREFLVNADKKGIVNQTITWDEFENELVRKTKELLSVIEQTNHNIIQAPCFSKIKDFSYRLS